MPSRRHDSEGSSRHCRRPGTLWPATPPPTAASVGPGCQGALRVHGAQRDRCRGLNHDRGVTVVQVSGSAGSDSVRRRDPQAPPAGRRRRGLAATAQTGPRLSQCRPRTRVRRAAGPPGGPTLTFGFKLPLWSVPVTRDSSGQWHSLVVAKIVTPYPAISLAGGRPRRRRIAGPLQPLSVTRTVTAVTARAARQRLRYIT